MRLSKESAAPNQLTLGERSAPARMQRVQQRVPAEEGRRLMFETFLAELSARFVNLPAHQVDSHIEDAQKRICLCLGLEHSALWQDSGTETGILLLTHLYRDSALPPPPNRMDGDTYFPWAQQKLKNREIICLPNTANAPPQAVVDKKSWQTYGIKSTLAFPLWVGDGPVFGVLSFASTSSEQQWPDCLVDRLRLLAEVFANALARQRTERTLTESEARVRLAAASANAGLWTMETISGRMWVTDKTKELFGIKPAEEVDLEKFLSLIHPEDRGAVSRAIEGAIQSREDSHIDYRVIRPDGEIRWMSSRGRSCAGEWGEPDRLMGVTIDITERKRAESALRETEERFRLVANTAPVMIWMSGTDKLFTFFNQGWLDFTGRSMEQELGEGWATGVHADDLNRCLTIYSEAFDARVEFRMEYRLRRFDGEFRWIVDHGTPRFEPGGRFVGYIGSCIDISEFKYAQEELQKSYAEVNQLKEKLQAESDYLQEEIKDIGRYEEIIGQSETLRKVLKKVEQVAHTESVVLITGETGTGKELIARAIHNRSKRNDRVMVKVDCAALPPTLIESELFGRERGAYTGASSRQIGRFETADGSTLFLDEIGEVGLELQAKLLRIVQEGEFERLGSAKTTRVSVRLIAATHRDLEERVKTGAFREDLFYRLNVFPIRVPPLRERLEDIPLLVKAFVREFEKKMGKTIHAVPSKTMNELQQYSWPGNIRELRNVIERAVIVTTGEKLNVEVPRTVKTASWRTLKEAECQHILTALEKTGWRIKGPHGAAQLLGMKSSTLYTAMRRLQIPTRHERGAIQS